MAKFDSYKDIADLLKQARSDLHAWQSARGTGEKPNWAGWAGASLSDMMREPDLTIRCLNGSDANIRLAAAALVAEYWPAAERFASETLRLAFEDPDARIRGAALTALLVLKSYITDPTRVLASLLAELFPGLSERQMVGWARKTDSDLADIRRKIKTMWEETAGAHAAQMIESRASAESYLVHPDPQLRRAALFALKNEWGPDEALSRACEKLIFEDADSQVRALALTCLAGCYMHTDDRRIGELIARLVYDVSTPREVRWAAYRSLFHIRGMPHEAFARVASPAFRFPEEVDWKLVQSFLPESTKEKGVRTISLDKLEE